MRNPFSIPRKLLVVLGGLADQSEGIHTLFRLREVK